MPICISRRTFALAATGAAAGLWVPNTVQANWWWYTVGAGVASGWLVEALKAWGLVPGFSQPTGVAATHRAEVAPLARQGYATTDHYSGAYSGGDFMVTEARQAEDFQALATTSHGRNTCTLRFDTADVTALGLVSQTLRQKGYRPRLVEQVSLPVHPPAAHTWRGNRRYSPVYMTPCHGEIQWWTDTSRSNANIVASIRSPDVNTEFSFGRRADGRWVYA